MSAQCSEFQSDDVQRSADLTAGVTLFLKSPNLQLSQDSFKFGFFVYTQRHQETKKKKKKLLPLTSSPSFFAPENSSPKTSPQEILPKKSSQEFFPSIHSPQNCFPIILPQRSFPNTSSAKCFPQTFFHLNFFLLKLFSIAIPIARLGFGNCLFFFGLGPCRQNHRHLQCVRCHLAGQRPEKTKKKNEFGDEIKIAKKKTCHICDRKRCDVVCDFLTLSKKADHRISGIQFFRLANFRSR